MAQIEIKAKAIIKVGTTKVATATTVAMTEAVTAKGTTVTKS